MYRCSRVWSAQGIVTQVLDSKQINNIAHKRPFTARMKHSNQLLVFISITGVEGA